MDLDANQLYDLALEAQCHLLGSEQAIWLDRLDEQRNALHALLEQWIKMPDQERALRLAGALSPFWWMRGYASLGQEFMNRVLDFTDGTVAARISALMGAGSLAYATGDFREAGRYYDQAIQRLRSHGEEHELARALDQAGMAERQLGNLNQAEGFHTEALEIQHRLGRSSEQALCLNNLGVVAFFRENFDAAQAFHNQALILREQVGDVRGQASSFNNLGQIARLQRDFNAALPLMEKGLALRVQLNDQWGIAGSHVNLAVVKAHLGRISDAQEHLCRAIAGFQAVGDALGLCECLEAGAELAQTKGQAAWAVKLLGAVDSRRESLSIPRPPIMEKLMTALVVELHNTLGDDEYQTAWQEGEKASDQSLDWLNLLW